MFIYVRTINIFDLTHCRNLSDDRLLLRALILCQFDLRNKYLIYCGVDSDTLHGIWPTMSCYKFCVQIVASTPGPLTFDKIGGPGVRWHATLDTP